jgi:hypothetical protein
VPTLPRYTQQVETTLTPVVPVRPAADAGVGLATAGQLLQQAGSTAASISRDVYERGVAAEVAKAEADLQEIATPTLSSALSQRGEKAFGAVDGARKTVTDAHKKILETLRTQDAKRLFEARSRGVMLGYQRSLEGHLAQQTRVADESKAAAQVAANVNAAALHYRDPAMLATLATQPEAILAITSDSQEEAAAKVAALRQDVYATAIQAALKAEDIDQAKALFYANREALGAKGPGIEAEINKSGLLREADSKAREIEATLRTGPDGWLDVTNLQAELDKIPDPRLKEATENEMRERVTLAAAAEKEQADTVWKLALGAYNSGGLRAAERVRLPDGRSAMEWLNVHAPDRVARLKDDAHTKWRQARADRDQSQREIREARTIARNNFLALSPEEQATVDLAAEFGLATDDVGMSDLRKLQTRAKAAVEKGEAVPVSEFVNDGMAQSFGLLNSIEPERKPGETKAQARARKAAELKAALQENYYQIEEEKRRKPNATEKQEVIDRLKVKHVEERSLNPFSPLPFGSDVVEYGFERETRMRAEGVRPALPSGAPLASTGEIPASELPKIDAALRAKNQPVTDANRRALYERVHGRR